MADTTDVIIIGAGPVGLTLAIHLRRLGLAVRVLDKAAQTKREQRACVIWPRSTEILADLGIIDDFTAASTTLHRAAIYANGRRLGAMDLGSTPSRYARPLVIEQNEIERLLASALARLGTEVEWQTEALAIAEVERGVRVTVRGAGGKQEVIEGSWVVGCEGTRSMVREKAGIAFEGGKRANLQALQINARPRWRYPYAPDEGYFFLAPHVSLGVFALPNGGYRFFCFTTDPDPSLHGAPTLEEMRDLIATVAHAPELQLEPTEPLWLSRARFQDRVAATLRRGRILLAGDAAHAWAPVGGRGMNAGIRGAQNLAWKLAAVHSGRAREGILDTYSDEQRATARAVMHEMSFNFLELPLPAAGLQAFAAIVPLALASKGIESSLDRTLSDLNMHHRTSSLSWQRASLGHYRAGDYLPDVAILSNDQRTSPAPLHSLLSSQHWTLLYYKHNPAGRYDSSSEVPEQLQTLLQGYTAPINVARIAPADASATHHLGRQPRLVLVRPDGHIGLTTTPDDTATLTRYLTTWLIPAERTAAAPAI